MRVSSLRSLSFDGAGIDSCSRSRCSLRASSGVRFALRSPVAAVASSVVAAISRSLAAAASDSVSSVM